MVHPFSLKYDKNPLGTSGVKVTDCGCDKPAPVKIYPALKRRYSDVPELVK